MKLKISVILAFLIIILASNIITPVFAAIFEDDFESGYTPWTGTIGSPTIDQVIVHHGVNSSKQNYTANFQNHYPYKYGLNTDPGYVRFYWYFDTLFGSGATHLLGESMDTGFAGIWKIWLYRNVTGTYIQLARTNPGALTLTASATYSAGNWYCLEIGFDVDAAAGFHKVWFEGNLIIDDSGIDTSGSNNFDKIRLGEQSQGSNGYVVYLDCVVVDSSYIGVEAAGVSVTHELTETFNITDNTIVRRSRRITESDTITITSVRSFGTERLFTYSEIIQITDAQDIGVSLAGVFFANLGTVNILDNLTFGISRLIVAAESILINSVHSIEVAIRLGIVEIFHSVNILSQIQTTIATVTVTTLTEVLALAAIAFIIAICALTITISKRN